MIGATGVGRGDNEGLAVGDEDAKIEPVDAEDASDEDDGSPEGADGDGIDDDDGDTTSGDAEDDATEKEEKCRVPFAM